MEDHLLINSERARIYQGTVRLLRTWFPRSSRSILSLLQVKKRFDKFIEEKTTEINSYRELNKYKNQHHINNKKVGDYFLMLSSLHKFFIETNQ